MLCLCYICIRNNFQQTCIFLSFILFYLLFYAIWPLLNFDAGGRRRSGCWEKAQIQYSNDSFASGHDGQSEYRLKVPVTATNEFFRLKTSDKRVEAQPPQSISPHQPRSKWNPAHQRRNQQWAAFTPILEIKPRVFLPCLRAKRWQKKCYRIL